MDKGEGGKLRDYLKEKKVNQDALALALGFKGRHGLIYHFKKDVLDYEFKMDLRKQGIELFDENGKLNLTPHSTVADGTPIYEQLATAGGNENTGQLPEVPSFHVKIPGYEDCNFGMHVFGHSMYPTIETGSLILCRKIQDKTLIMYGEIYLIRTKDYLMVKRLQKNDKKGFVMCISDNYEKRSEEFKRFEPFDMAIDKIIDLYLVKGIIKKTQS